MHSGIKNHRIDLKNLLDINLNKFEKDFIFIVNDQEYKTNRIVAEVLSPKIRKIQQIDESNSVFRMNIQQEGNFNKVLELGELKEIDILPNEVEYFQNVLNELGNYDECCCLIPILQEELNINNVVKRTEIKCKYVINCEEEIQFISKNFHEINNKLHSELILLDSSVFDKIFSNAQFKILFEDEIMDLIIELVQKSSEYSSLFEYVIFPNVSPSRIEKFLDIFDITNLNEQIWKQLGVRLSCDIKTESKTYFGVHESRYLFTTSNNSTTNNIIQYFTNQCGGNVHSKGVINVTASSINHSSMNVENCLIKDDSHVFATRSLPNQWIQFDFKEKRVALTSYTIKDIHTPYLKSWILEGSNDGINFQKLDEHNDFHGFGSNPQYEFTITEKIPFQFIRLKGNQTNNIVITQIDFSGKIYQ